LNHKHLHTLERIFQHPASHNLEWKDVISLVEHLGTVEEEENGRMKFTLNGASEIFHRTQDKKDVSDVPQVLDLRRFLTTAGIGKDGTMAHPLYAEPHTLEELLTAKEEATAPEKATEPVAHGQNEGRLNAERNRQAEQQLKTQQHEQNDRAAFPKALAQEHTRGNR
jgi:hypothetical protein